MSTQKEVMRAVSSISSTESMTEDETASGGASLNAAEEIDDGNRDGQDSSQRDSSSNKTHTSMRKSQMCDEVGFLHLRSAKERDTSLRLKAALTTADKLRFDTLGLHGRDEEIDILKKCLKRLGDAQDGKDRTREMVLIKGESGTGKTALASTLIYPIKKSNGLYARGKFDLYLRDEPHAGIAALCREICGEILQLRDVKSSDSANGRLSFQSIRGELINKLGSEIHLLINIIPELTEVVGDEALMVEDVKKQGNQEAKARSNYAFRVFIRVVTSFFAPLVLVLDDLQWADAASLDLIDVLISDVENTSLMVIGIYRSEEINEAHLLSRLERELKEKTEQGIFNLTEIAVGNLDVPRVNQILMHLLSIDEPETTLTLAEICHKRSLGNVFFLLVFVKMLKEEQLLHFNLGLFKWRWDEQNIVSHTAATHNAVEMMRRRIKKMPNFVSHHLSVAACLGTSFEPKMVRVVWRDIGSRWDTVGESETDSMGYDDDDIWLDIAENDGIIEKNGESSAYQWIHDKVQEAAISLVPVDELPSMKTQIGEVLVREFKDTDLDSSIFVAVNLLNEGSRPKQASKQIQLAELNLRAAKKAVDFSAFESSGKYATLGVEILPPDHWATHYELTLDLYSTAAEATGYLGKVEQMKTYCDRVLERKDRPTTDKLRVYNVLVDYLGNSGHLQEAADLLTEILKQLGCKFPKRKLPMLFATLSGVFKANAKVKSLTTQAITAMPKMKDPIQLEIMKLLGKLTTVSFLCKSYRLPLVILASFRTTLKYGLCEYSPPAFATLCFIFRAILGDFESELKCGSLAALIMEKLKCKSTESRTRMIVYSFVLCWIKPLKSVRLQLLKGYQMGLSSGDTESALRCISFYILNGFLTGVPLKTLEADSRIYSKQMLEFAKETIHADTCVCWQAVLNLMGRGEHSTKIEGEVILNLDEFLSGQNADTIAAANSLQIMLYTTFGEYEKGANFAVENKSVAQVAPGVFAVMADAFSRAVCLYAMARKTKRRKYRKHAKKIHSEIKSWSVQGNPNVKHYENLLNAELAALGNKLDEAESWYQRAVVVASRAGFLHDAALANERYGEFLLQERNDKDEAVYKFEEALKLYGEWGATRKVTMIRDQYTDLWPTPTEIGPKVSTWSR